jgi:hypothetical protein
MGDAMVTVTGAAGRIGYALVSGCLTGLAGDDGSTLLDSTPGSGLMYWPRATG